MDGPMWKVYKVPHAPKAWYGDFFFDARFEFTTFFSHTGVKISCKDPALYLPSPFN